MISSRWNVRPVALACLFALPGLACAQTSDGTASDTVVVTGAARAMRTLELPFAVNAVDAEATRQAGPMINLSEVLVRVPGLVVNNRNNYAQDLQISSRGFGARAGFGVRGLRLYTDGIPATMPDGQGQVAHVDLAGAARIEVLRGPFSVLYGNSSGGVIAVFSAPAKAGQSELATDIGSFGLRQNRLSVASPLGRVAGGALDIRASFTHVELDGFRPQSAASRDLGSLRLGWQGADDTLTLLVSDHTQAAQDPLGLTREQFEADPRQTTAQALPFQPGKSQFNTRKTIRQSQAGINWRHAFADTSVLRESSVSAYLGSRGVTQFLSITTGAQTPATSGGGVVDFDRDYHGIEAKLSWRFGPVDVVTGVDIEDQLDDRRGYRNYTGTAAAPTALGVVGDLRRNENNKASTRDAYVQAEAPLGDALTLTGGVRSGRVTMRTDDHYIATGNGDDSGQLRYTYTNPVLGLRWMLAKGWSLHASAARGFESPTLGELAYQAGAAGGFNSTLKGQTSRQLELGSKWRSQGLELDAALFQADTRDEIGVLSNSGGRSVFQNVGRTQRRGLEMSAAWQALPTLRLQASATWLNAEYLDAFQTCAVAGCPSTANPRVSVAAGNRISGTAARTAWAEAAWKPNWLPGEMGLEWRASARMAANDTNNAWSGGYALANLRWRGSIPLGAQDSIELLARVDNLFDRAYVGSVIVNDGNSRFFEPGSPRSGLVSLRWQHRW